MSSWIYVHNLSPFVIHVQLFGQTVGVRWYGLAYVLGLALAFFSFRSAARQGYLPNFSTQVQEQMFCALVVGVVGGGRLGFVLQHPARLLSEPLFPFRVWEGGMAFFGGLIGVALALLWTSKRHNVNFWSLADVATFPSAFGLGVGRVANFINGELWGPPTGENWGVIFPKVDLLPRHPSQLYEAISHFLLFGTLVCVLRYRSHRIRQSPGTLAALFMTMYGGLRFFTDLYRADDTFFGPFSSGQWASLLVAAIGAVLLWRKQGASKNDLTKAL